MTRDWHGEWLSLPELAVRLNKNYGYIKRLYRRGELDIAGIRCYRLGPKGKNRRVWVRVDRSACV